MSNMKIYPLLIKFRDIIAGNGYVAQVAIDGRALLTVEEDGTNWVHGVQPGGVSGGDTEPACALNEFKTRYQSVLYDIAIEAATFADFEREVRAFFEEVNADDVKDWEEALAEVRRTNASLTNLPTMRAENVPSNIQIVLVSHAQPQLNQFDTVLKAA